MPPKSSSLLNLKNRPGLANFRDFCKSKAASGTGDYVKDVTKPPEENFANLKRAEQALRLGTEIQISDGNAAPSGQLEPPTKYLKKSEKVDLELEARLQRERIELEERKIKEEDARLQKLADDGVWTGMGIAPSLKPGTEEGTALRVGGVPVNAGGVGSSSSVDNIDKSGKKNTVAIRTDPVTGKFIVSDQGNNNPSESAMTSNAILRPELLELENDKFNRDPSTTPEDNSGGFSSHINNTLTTVSDLLTTPKFLLQEQKLEPSFSDDHAQVKSRSVTDIKRALREDFAQPITLFGETEMMRYRRLRYHERRSLIVESSRESQSEFENLGHGRNDFGRLMREMEGKSPTHGENLTKAKKRQQLRLEREANIAKNRERFGGDESLWPAGAALPIGTPSPCSSDDPEESPKMVLGGEEAEIGKASVSADLNLPSDYVAALNKANDIVTITPEEAAAKKAAAYAALTGAPKIRAFIKTQLDLWEDAVEARGDPSSPTSSRDHKLDAALFKTTKKDVKPLLKQLKESYKSTTSTASSSSGFDKDDLCALNEMVTACDNREYSHASKRYMDITIGKQSWPIGVTSVSIHERSGKTKIFENKMSAKMSDEGFRRSIQGFRRLMVKCQEWRPPDDGGKRM